MCNSLNWTYLYDAKEFLQFPFLIRVLEIISVPNHSRDSFILIKVNTMSSCPEIVSVHWKLRVIHLIGHIIMMQMDSFNFRF